MNKLVDIASSDETGALGVKHLKRFWSASSAARGGCKIARETEWQTDRLLLDALGLGLQQTMQYIFQHRPDFAAFEDWIVDTAGKPDPLTIKRLNATISAEPVPDPVCEWLGEIENITAVLTDDELTFWEENGYVIVRDAVSPQARAAAEAAIWEYSGATPGEPETWYQPADPGIMLELIQHPALQANRRSNRTHKAFSQIWGTADLWVSADRCGLHPPQNSNHPFPGPDLHWDIDFSLPLKFATQGILYLTDTPADQGALTLVPGFHHRINDWLDQLAPGSNPNAQDLHALGSKSIGGQAGDLIIWHQLLPHGASPNLGQQPRIVQYINMYPSMGASILTG